MHGGLPVLQGLSCVVLLYLLNKRVKLQLAGGRALQDTLHFLRPTGRPCCMPCPHRFALGLSCSFVDSTRPWYAAALSSSRLAASFLHGSSITTHNWQLPLRNLAKRKDLLASVQAY